MVRAEALPSALSASRVVVRLLVGANLIFGSGVLALLITSVVAEDWVVRALHIGPADTTLTAWMRLVMVIGLASVPFTHVLLTRLLAIIDAVRLGDAFVVENAARLRTMAWALLGLEILHLAIGVVAGAGLAGTKVDLDWSFSVTPWLAVLLLFVLAQVFDDGARMRDDLRGTV